MFKRLFALLILSLVMLTASGVGIAHAASDRDFMLSADFRGLYPNADLVVPVSVYNPQRYDLAVHAATAIVSDASPQCPASNVIAQTFSGDVVVRSHERSIVPVRMQMLATAPDACQGAVFPLTFDAHAEIVNGTGGPDRGFAFTGASVGLLIVVGVLAVGVGLTLVLRRRNVSEVQA
ncbi:MAG: hypothetical protein ABJC79_04350 [Acidimicrobiia bacterium]